MTARVIRLREWAARREHSWPSSWPSTRKHGWTWLSLVLSFAAAPAAHGLLDRLRFLPPSLRDRPWPLELSGFLLAVAAGVWFRRGSTRSAIRAAAAVAGVIAVSVFARAYQDRLPAAPPELMAQSRLPPFSVQDSSGRVVTNASLRGHPTVIVVYRGAWCAYCRKQLAVLAAEVRRFADTPVKVVAVSPDPPARLVQLERSLQLPQILLSDANQNLPGLCVSSSHCVLVLDAQGTVRWGGFTDNWRDPPRYATVLQAAYRLQRSVLP